MHLTVARTLTRATRIRPPQRFIAMSNGSAPSVDSITASLSSLAVNDAGAQAAAATAAAAPLPSSSPSSPQPSYYSYQPAAFESYHRFARTPNTSTRAYNINVVADATRFHSTAAAGGPSNDQPHNDNNNSTPQNRADINFTAPLTPQRPQHSAFLSSSYRTPPSGSQSVSSPPASSGRRPASHSKKPPASPLSPKPYLSSSLRPLDAAGYRAAGVFAFRMSAAGGGRVDFLFGRESHPENRSKHNRLNILGGKIDEKDVGGAIETAVREFIEESGELIGSIDEISTRIQQQKHGVLWYPAAKYSMYFYEMTRPHEIEIVEAYASAKSSTAAGVGVASRPSVDYSEMSDLHWVDGSTLLTYLASQTHRSAHSICDDPITTIDGQAIPMVSFTVGMMKHQKVQEKIKQLIEQAKAKVSQANMTKQAESQTQSQSSE